MRTPACGEGGQHPAEAECGSGSGLPALGKPSDTFSTHTKQDSLSFLMVPSKKPQPWSDGDTELFYACLEVYGRHFALFQHQLCHKSLRQISRKFHKEQKRRAGKVAEALQRYAANPHTAAGETMTEILANSFEDRSEGSLDDIVDRRLKLLESQAEGMHSAFPSLDFFLREL